MMKPQYYIYYMRGTETGFKVFDSKEEMNYWLIGDEATKGCNEPELDYAYIVAGYTLDERKRRN